MTVLLVTIGVVVRATDSGMGCPDWPLCHGQVIPPLDDPKAWIEWVHRTVAAIIGFMILGVAFLAWKDHRHQRSILIPSIAAVLLVGFQAWLGRETVRLNNSGESVTAHLAAAMALVALLVFILARSLYPARIGGRGGSQRFTILAAFAGLSVFALLLFGSNVTATSQWFVFPDWPLMNGSLVPPLTADTSADVLFPIQAVIGGLQILTDLAAWTQTLHVALGAIIWAAFVGLVTVSYFEARIVRVPEAGLGDDAGSEEARGQRRTRSESIRAYLALTKPRIIELLLVTTVPAMVLATREVPGIQLGHWTWLTVWTLVGGTLAAGSANAITCYLDRDIDELMIRTRRRPLPAHEVEPERAVVFGLVLGVISFVVLAWFVNLLSAF